MYDINAVIGSPSWNLLRNIKMLYVQSPQKLFFPSDDEPTQIIITIFIIAGEPIPQAAQYCDLSNLLFGISCRLDTCSVIGTVPC